MQNYKEINGNDYVKDSRTTINETMRSIQSMNSGTVFPTTNLFEGMKCYRTDLKKTYTLTDVENNTWVEDDTASKLSAARKINLTGDATGTTTFDGSGDASISVTVNESKHAAAADEAIKLNTGQAGSITVNQSGYSDYSPTVGGNYANMNISSWFGVSFTSQCGGSVPKGKTAVGIDCREGIVRARRFEGSLNGTATNADTVDGVHAGIMYYNKGDWAADNWATMGAYQVNNISITGGAYGWGQVISSSTADARFQLYATHQYGGDGRLHYRTGWDNDKDQPWNTILDSENYNSFAPTKTGSGASGTWPISVSGTAEKANGLTGNLVFPDIGNVATSNKISWNGSTDGADIYYQTTASDQGNLVLNLRDNPNCYLRIACNGAFKSYFSPNDGNFHGNVNGNADNATNADTVDGYHASDILNRITAANTGGIVAASLTENGYVKFANGLILQWGFVSNTKAAKNYDITFPVSFASACFGVHNTYFKSSGEAGKSGDNWDTVAKITKYGCQLSADNQNVFWTAIGV